MDKTCGTCPTCGGESKFEGRCGACIMADFEDIDDDNGDCPQCHGDGFTYDCFEEWACVDPEGGCDLCMRRCDVCGPHPFKTKEPPHAG